MQLSITNRNCSLHAPNNNIIDRDVNKFNKESNKAHDQKTNTSSLSDLCKLY